MWYILFICPKFVLFFHHFVTYALLPVNNFLKKLPTLDKNPALTVFLTPVLTVVFTIVFLALYCAIFFTDLAVLECGEF